MTLQNRDLRTVWGVTLPDWALTDEERDYLASLPNEVPSHAWVCDELDRVWHQLGMDNRRPLAEQSVEEFYGHPVWVMNGLFSSADPASVSERRAIGSYVAGLRPTLAADFGGGFGELAQRISWAVPTADVDIVEPFPTQVARVRLADSPRVKFVPELALRSYDVMVAQDVLEHVEQPVALAIELVTSVRPGGRVIFVNNFTPIVACHIPGTFHLKHTFTYVMRALGLTYWGTVPGAKQADIYVVPAALRVRQARMAAQLSRISARAVAVAGAIRRRLATASDANRRRRSTASLTPRSFAKQPIPLGRITTAMASASRIERGMKSDDSYRTRPVIRPEFRGRDSSVATAPS